MKLPFISRKTICKALAKLYVCRKEMIKTVEQEEDSLEKRRVLISLSRDKVLIEEVARELGIYSPILQHYVYLETDRREREAEKGEV